MWNRDMLTGAPDLDADHDRLLATLAALDHAVTTGQPAARSRSLLERLTTETAEHFAAEEQEMTRAGYPMAASHTAQHTLFLAELDRLGGGTEEITARLVEFVQMWFARHIDIADKPLAEWLRSGRS